MIAQTETNLTARLDNMRWNGFHSRALGVLGLGWGMDAFEVTLVGSILGVLGPYWHLSGIALSGILASWFAGIMLGALGFGALADRLGRRAVFLGSLILYGAATFFTAFAPDIWPLLILRFVAGLGVGAEYSAVNAAIAEFMPAAKRGFAASLVMNFWSVGTLAAAGLAWAVFALVPPDAGWRLVFACGGLVALASLWLRRRMPESPRWLLAQGRVEEAEAVVAGIAQGQSVVTKPVGLGRPRARSIFVDWRVLWARHRGALALGCALDFAEAGGYYGLFAFLPLAVLPHLHLTAAALPGFYILGSLGALAGGLGVSFALDKLGRKPVVSFCYGATALGCLLFAACAPAGEAALITGFVVVNLLATASWVGAYPTFSELFPTALRASGVGLSVAFGRIGAILSPFMIAAAGQVSLAAALGVLAGFWALGFAAMLVWTRFGLEARGVPLERISQAA